MNKTEYEIKKSIRIYNYYCCKLYCLKLNQLRLSLKNKDKWSFYYSVCVLQQFYFYFFI